MMPDSDQPTPTPFERPSARALNSMPVQRGNYGIPPRQAAPQAQVQPQPQPMARPMQSGPRSMDIMTPRPAQPSQPQPATSQPVAPAPQPVPVTADPSEPAADTEQVLVTQSPSRPLFTNKPAVETQPVEALKSGGLLPKVRLALLVVGALLTLGGAARWITAGSTSSDLIAAGAVAANDGNTMTIQFTANDGAMHKFTTKSDSKLTPGTGVEVAYKSGAADNGAKRVAPIKAAHGMGIFLMITGVVILLVAGATSLLMRRQPKHGKRASIATPVTV